MAANLSFYIAKRYFFSWKKKTIINIISILAVVAVMACTCSLIIILSAFNGMDTFVKNLFGKFDPHLTIVPTIGKSFESDATKIEHIKNLEGIAQVSEIIEDNALLKYKDRQVVVKVKGIEPAFLQAQFKAASISSGNASIYKDSTSFALVGLGVQNELALSRDSKNMYPLQYMYPKAGKIMGSLTPNLLNLENIRYAGSFSIERQYDETYTFAPLKFVERLTEMKNRRTAIEILVNDKSDIKKLKSTIQQYLGEEYIVKDSLDLHVSLLKAHNIEKLITFLIFSFILLIASLNIFFALSMLTMEKKKDIAIMKSIGFTAKAIRNTYLQIGYLVAVVGTGFGLVVGLLVVLAQQQFGLKSMGMNNGLISSYPVELRWLDFVFVATIVMLVTLLVSYIPARKAASINISQEV